MTENPYGKYVAGEDLLITLERTPARIAGMVRGWPDAAFARRHAPGKWTARQVLTHLAQAEIVFANRLRFALAEDGYVIQPFDQDVWMETEPALDGRAALEAYLALRQLNLALCRRLTPQQRSRVVTHPERGPVTVEWLMTFFAGHERNHLPQLETINDQRSTINDER
jgi:uncharacterized damage-inducible protein DinB